MLFHSEHYSLISWALLQLMVENLSGQIVLNDLSLINNF